MAKGSAQTLLCTPQIARENTLIDENYDEKKLAVMLRQVEDDIIRPIIGVPLYFSVLDKINTNTLAGDYLTLVDQYLIPLTLRWLQHDFVLYSSYQFKAKGVTQAGGPNETPASMSDQKALRDSLRSKAEDFSNVVIRYLKASMANNTFPEYNQYITIEDTPGANSVKSSNIVLPKRWGTSGFNVTKGDGCDNCGGPDDWANRFINIQL